MTGLEATITDFLKLTFLSMVPFVLASQGTMLRRTYRCLQCCTGRHHAGGSLSRFPRQLPDRQ